MGLEVPRMALPHAGPDARSALISSSVRARRWIRRSSMGPWKTAQRGAGHPGAPERG
jgi:hypothetical protein